MASKESVEKSAATIKLLNDNVAYIEYLVYSGLSVNLIMRKLHITTDHSLRKWFRNNRPDLEELVKINGNKRLHKKGVCNADAANCNIIRNNTL